MIIKCLEKSFITCFILIILGFFTWYSYESYPSCIQYNCVQLEKEIKGNCTWGIIGYNNNTLTIIKKIKSLECDQNNILFNCYTFLEQKTNDYNPIVYGSLNDSVIISTECPMYFFWIALFLTIFFYIVGLFLLYTLCISKFKNKIQNDYNDDYEDENQEYEKDKNKGDYNI